MNYFNALKYLIKTRQGILEGYESYIKQVRSTIKTLILTGGRHVLCSNDIMEVVDQANPSEKETTSEE